MENDGKLHRLGLKILDKVSNVIVVSTAGQDNEKRYTLKTLDMLGLLTVENIISKRVVIFYDAPNAVRDELYSKRCTGISCGGKKYFDVTLNWYYAIKAAIVLLDEVSAADADRGKYAMFLENDCVVTKAALSGEIDSLLDSVPEDADFVNFNAVQAWVGPGADPVKNNKKAFFSQLRNTSSGNKEYAEITGTCRSFNCVMMSRRFCEKLASTLEKNLSAPNAQYIIDEYQTKSFFPDMKMYMSRRPLMVQYDDSRPKHTECFLSYHSLARGDCVIPREGLPGSKPAEEPMRVIGRKLEQAFDKIVVISMISDGKPCSQTLGILDSAGVLSQENIKSQKVVIQYDRPNMMRRAYCKNLQSIRNGKLECAYIFLNHYMAIADAYFGGAESALFLEDDCILPKDVGRVLEILDGIPKDYDYVNFNATIRRNMRSAADIKDFMARAWSDSIDGNYARMKTPVANGCCYAMSRKHMRAAVKYLEHVLELKKITEVDQLLNDPAAFPGSKMYLTKFPLMSQIYDEQRGSHTQKDLYDKQYLSYGMSIDDFMTDNAGSPEYQEERVKRVLVPKVKGIAFYLPQFHRIPENDAFWGDGFTEWTNCKKAVPLFRGHNQPRVPHEDIGYYDLSDWTVLKKQAEMAKRHGVYGFCFYRYWFGEGRELLQKPLELLLEHMEIDIKYCLCWANENWTRNWNGGDKAVLIKQEYGQAEEYVRGIRKWLDDPRYIRVDGKPLVVVYRPQLLPDAQKTFGVWREYARKEGIGELFIAVMRWGGFRSNGSAFVQGADAEIEFPPSATAPGDEKKDYKVLVENVLLGRSYIEKFRDHVVFRGVMGEWDNSPRGNKSVWKNFSTEDYRRWLKYATEYAKAHNKPSQRFVFINAWNEWSEGTYLEPDRARGYAMLNATSDALASSSEPVLNLTCLTNGKNYGQRLQAYAMQRYIEEKFGKTVALVDRRSDKERNPFLDFEKSYMNIVRADAVDFDGIDVAIVGGDQVLTYLGEAKSYFPDEYVGKMKMCTYAASANGTLAAGGKDVKAKIGLLRRCNKIGLREQADVDAVKKALQLEIQLNIDPVMLLNVERWADLAKRPPEIQEDEVFDLFYGLGDSLDEVLIDAETRVKTYRIYGNVSQRRLGGRVFQPDEFLWMIMNCRNFITQSFHGFIFALMFGRKVDLTVKAGTCHGSMRMDSLVAQLGVEFGEDGAISNRDDVIRRLDERREAARKYLEKCLSCEGFKYACYARENEIRQKSASGGACALLARHFINNLHGVVYGAAYSDDFKSVKTVRVDSVEDYFKKISKSKYSYCRMPDINETKQDLESGTQVLFIGCPCQVKQLKESLGKAYGNLTAVDLLCNGYSRPEILKEFVEKQEKTEGSRLVHLDMRPKHCFGLQMKFANGKEKVVQNVVQKVFVCNKENYMRECLECNMHTAGSSAADLTIGDFWDYGKHKDVCDQQFAPKNGTNAVYVNTEKGRSLFNGLKKDLEWRYLT